MLQLLLENKPEETGYKFQSQYTSCVQGLELNEFYAPKLSSRNLIKYGFCLHRLIMHTQPTAENLSSQAFKLASGFRACCMCHSFFSGVFIQQLQPQNAVFKKHWVGISFVTYGGGGDIQRLSLLLLSKFTQLPYHSCTVASRKGLSVKYL